MLQTPLHLAAHYSLIEAVRWLLSNGADVNARCYNQMTPLHLAQEPEVVRLLAKHKADLNARGACGTALQEAAKNVAHFGQRPQWKADCERAGAITKILIEAGADYDIVSACCLGDLHRIKELTTNKVHARNPEAMRMAATYGRTAIVELLLEKGADPENAEYGDLPLSYFAVEHPAVLQLLFDAGADPKVRLEYHGNGMGPDGTTLLHEAAAKGAVESARLLVMQGVGIDQLDSHGSTPLDLACFGGQVEVVEWLLENKANVNAHADKGQRPMSEATRGVWPERDEENNRYQAVIRLLERAGVESDIFAAIACNDVKRVVSILQSDPRAGSQVQKNQSGLPALHLAVILDRAKILKLLLDAGTDPNLRSTSENVGYKGETALSEAAFWGRFEIARTLIEHGADVNASAERGVTPLHEAAYTDHVEVAKLLLEHGAVADAKDDERHTPLDGRGDRVPSQEMVDLLNKHGVRH